MPFLNRLKAIGQERLPVGATAVGLARSNFLARVAQTALLTVETATIRYFTDGTTATSTTGTLVYPGGEIELENPGEIESFSAIRTGTVSATIQAVYHG